ncbi:MAG: FKBP-type peptidyl-prolyl cis-trans isomerase [Thermoplasmata archaeon]
MNKYYVSIVVVILVGIAVEAGLYYYMPKQTSSVSPPITIAVGDNVSVNYIGYLPNGQVFDTSMYSVAINNQSYPKAVSFTFRGVNQYTPLKVHVGSSGGNNVYIITVTGFWENLLGMSVNQSKIFVVPPSLGYGKMNPNLIRTYPIISNLSAMATYNTSFYSKLYPNQPPDIGAVFKDPYWGWNDTIMSVNSSYISVLFTPYIGEIINPYHAWNMEVIGITSNSSGTTIMLKNLVTPSMIGNIMGKDFSGNSFILYGINYSNSTYTVNYNKQVVGVDLTFDVTVVSIQSNTNQTASS